MTRDSIDLFDKEGLRSPSIAMSLYLARSLASFGALKADTWFQLSISKAAGEPTEELRSINAYADYLHDGGREAEAEPLTNASSKSRKRPSLYTFPPSANTRLTSTPLVRKRKRKHS